MFKISTPFSKQISNGEQVPGGFTLLTLIPLLLALALVYFLLKYVILPAYVRWVVLTLKLNKDIAFDHVLVRLDQQGVHANVKIEVLDSIHSLLPPGMKVSVKLNKLDVIERELNECLASIITSDPVILVGGKNVRIIQDHLIVDLSQSSQVVAELARRIVIAGQKEVDRLVLVLKMSIDLNIGGWLTLDNFQVEKTLYIKDENQRQVAKFTRHISACQEELLTSGKHVSFDPRVLLVPLPTIQLLPVVPALKSILGGLSIQWSHAPRLNLKLGVIRFKSTLNGSIVASGSIAGLDISSNSMTCLISLEIVPSIISSKPLQGLATMAKGVFQGALSGTVNGLLYGEWGAQSSLVGLSGLSIENEDGIELDWLKRILASIEIEKDLEVAKQVKSRASKVKTDLSEAFGDLAAQVLESQRGKCLIM